jgi:hypothetical protein
MGSDVTVGVVATRHKGMMRRLRVEHAPFWGVSAQSDENIIDFIDKK